MSSEYWAENSRKAMNVQSRSHSAGNRFLRKNIALNNLYCSRYSRVIGEHRYLFKKITETCCRSSANILNIWDIQLVLEIFRIFKNLFGPAAYELENTFSNICGKDFVPGRDLFDWRWLNIQAGGTGKNHPEY